MYGHEAIKPNSQSILLCYSGSIDSSVRSAPVAPQPESTHSAAHRPARGHRPAKTTATRKNAATEPLCATQPTAARTCCKSLSASGAPRGSRTVPQASRTVPATSAVEAWGASATNHTLGRSPGIPSTFGNTTQHQGGSVGGGITAMGRNPVRVAAHRTELTRDSKPAVPSTRLLSAPAQRPARRRRHDRSASRRCAAGRRYLL